MGGNGNAQVFVNGVPVNMPSMQKPPPIVKTIIISFKKAYLGGTVPVQIERWVQQNNTRSKEQECVYVDIPRGVDEKEMIIIRKKGNINGTLQGDLKFFIKIQNETNFGRNGLDLLYTHKISLKEALTGFSFGMKFIDDNVYTINNSSGKIIKPSYKKIIQNMGMQRENCKGNLVITFKIEFPNSLSEEQKNALKTIL